MYDSNVCAHIGNLWSTHAWFLSHCMWDMVNLTSHAAIPATCNLRHSVGTILDHITIRITITPIHTLSPTHTSTTRYEEEHGRGISARDIDIWKVWTFHVLRYTPSMTL